MLYSDSRSPHRYLALPFTLALVMTAITLIAGSGADQGTGPSAQAQPPGVRVQSLDKVVAEKAAWGSLRWLVNAKLDPQSGMTLGVVQINAGQSNPPHIHGNCEEVIYVLSGSCEHWVGEQKVVLKAGDALRIPAGVPHQARALGGEPMRAVVTYNTGERQFTPVSEKAK